LIVLAVVPWRYVVANYEAGGSVAFGRNPRIQ
jgi:hypothetical protein